MSKCEVSLCSLNWLDEGYSIRRVEDFTLATWRNPVFVFFRHEDKREVRGVFCEEHTIYGLWELLKSRGCEP